MNLYHISFTLVVCLSILFLLMSREFKGAIITPGKTVNIPSQKDSSGGGGGLMYIFSELGVPGWKWGDCC